MRTFESLQSSPADTSVSPNISEIRTGSTETTIYPPGFEELGVRGKNSVYSTIRRKEVIHANIKLAGEFLTEQSSGLSEIQQTLMLWSKSRSRSENIQTESIVFMHPIESILLRKYMNVPLFGDGTEDPMKLHYLDSGRRQYFALHILPLLSQPSLSALRIAAWQKQSIPLSLLNSCGGEILTLRLLMDSRIGKLNQLLDQQSDTKKEISPHWMDGSQPGIFFKFLQKALSGSFVGRFRYRADATPKVPAPGIQEHC